MGLYPPPARLPVSIFSRLPDKFRHKVPTAWADANRGGNAVDSFLEGPSFDRASNLYVTDIPFGRIFRISPDGMWTLVTEYDGWPTVSRFTGMAASSSPTTSGGSCCSTRTAAR
jgi:hypothetical protein